MCIVTSSTIISTSIEPLYNFNYTPLRIAAMSQLDGLKQLNNLVVWIGTSRATLWMVSYSTNVARSGQALTFSYSMLNLNPPLHYNELSTLNFLES